MRSVAVVGDGPAGTALATWLARAGVRVGLFSRGRPEGPLVGESLVPRVVSFLRDLGIENEVRSYSVLKPGARFLVSKDDAVELRFDEVCRRIPGYAYNVPRDLACSELRGSWFGAVRRGPHCAAIGQRKGRPRPSRCGKLLEQTARPAEYGRAKL